MAGGRSPLGSDGFVTSGDITTSPDIGTRAWFPDWYSFAWDAPLFFANTELFHARVLTAVEQSPTPVRWVVVEAEPVTNVDVTAADMIAGGRMRRMRVTSSCVSQK